MRLDRQAQILHLIRENAIETQEELVRRLNESGFNVTQATVSRDIRALKLTKVTDGGGRTRYVSTDKPVQNDEGKFKRMLQDAFVSMAPAGNLLVIRTASGMAMAAAAALDALHLEEVVGCIAGDDTIMCATVSEASVSALTECLRAMLEAGKPGA